MKQLAVFQTPYTPPERSARETFDWVVAQAAEADRLGFAEYWCGEHATLQWEGVPSPELVLAAAVRETEQIKLCPGAHLLPYHHPATLAVQVSWMTHVTQGRYILGIGAGAFPSDAALRGLKDLSANHRMVAESLEIMRKVWAAEPFEHRGEFWAAGYPEPNEFHGSEGTLLGPVRDLRPYGGHVEMGMSGLTMNSSSIRYAGANGLLPLSIFAGAAQLSNHWEVYASASAEAGQDADRAAHHVVMDCVVAETDEEARRLAVEGPMGQAWREYVLGGFKAFAPGLLADVMDRDAASAVEYLADHVWMVGSPDTVVEKFRALADEAGGPWGTTMVFGYDYSEAPAAWNRSLELLATEVGPRLAAEFDARAALA